MAKSAKISNNFKSFRAKIMLNYFTGFKLTLKSTLEQTNEDDKKY